MDQPISDCSGSPDDTAEDDYPSADQDMVLVATQAFEALFAAIEGDDRLAALLGFDLRLSTNSGTFA